MNRPEMHDIAAGLPRYMAWETSTTVEQRRAAGQYVVRMLGPDCRDVLDELGIEWGNTR